MLLSSLQKSLVHKINCLQNEKMNLWIFILDEKRPDEKNGKTAVQKTELGKMKRIADDEREDEMDENLDQVCYITNYGEIMVSL